MVEFALIFPILFALLLGIYSCGVVYDKKLSLTAGAREGARYGATVAPEQLFASGSWATNVRNLAIARATGSLDSPNASICVSLVSGSPASTHQITSGTVRAKTWFSTKAAGAPCDATETYPVTAADGGLRVQVIVSVPAKLEAALFSQEITITERATVQSESAS